MAVFDGTDVRRGSYLPTVLDETKQAVTDRLLTRRGQRYFRPDYGTRIVGLRGSPLTPELVGTVSAETVVALETEHRLVLRGVGIRQEETRLVVRVDTDAGDVFETGVGA